MSDPEIEALRAVLAARPRPPGVAERRERLDALGNYTIDPAIRLEPVQIDQIEAEWATAPGADPTPRHPLYPWRRLYLRLAPQPSRAGDGGRPGGGRPGADPGLSPGAGGSLPRRGGGCRRRLSLHAGPGPLAEPHRIAGDSAGGGLTMALMIAPATRGLPLPACGWCISPWVDMEAQQRQHGDQGRDRSDHPEARRAGDGRPISAGPIRARRWPPRSMPIFAACRRS